MSDNDNPDNPNDPPKTNRFAKQQLPRLEVGVGPSRKAAKDQIIERFEQKYIIHPRLVPQIRKYLQPFCIPDPNGKGDIPEYIVTTLQLDTPQMDLALAKERKMFARFKLRIRTYGTDANPNLPVFVELKRKVGGVIIKSRSKMKRGDYKAGMLLRPEEMPTTASRSLRPGRQVSEGQRQPHGFLAHHAPDRSTSTDAHPLHPRVLLWCQRRLRPHHV